MSRAFSQERTAASYVENEDFSVRPESPSVIVVDRQKQLESQREFDREKQRQADEREFHRQEMRDKELQREIDREKQRERHEASADSRQSGVGLIIGNQLANPDPVSLVQQSNIKRPFCFTL